MYIAVQRVILKSFTTCLTGFQIKYDNKNCVHDLLKSFVLLQDYLVVTNRAVALNMLSNRLFNTHPETQKEFKAFAGRDPETLRENSRMAAHSSSFMSAISNIVDNLNDPSTLNELLKTTGRNHSRRGMKKEYFEVRFCER